MPADRQRGDMEWTMHSQLITYQKLDLLSTVATHQTGAQQRVHTQSLVIHLQTL